MGMHRANKAKGQGGGKAGYNALWFIHNVRRVRKRNKIAKLSRKQNRGK